MCTGALYKRTISSQIIFFIYINNEYYIKIKISYYLKTQKKCKHYINFSKQIFFLFHISINFPPTHLDKMLHCNNSCSWKEKEIENEINFINSDQLMVCVPIQMYFNKKKKNI